jgi:hypothetical protein
MKLTSVCAAVLLALASPLSVFGQERGLEAKLNAKLADYRVDADNLLQATVQVASEFQLPLGLELPTRNVKPIHRHYRDTTVKDVLKDLVATEQGYKLQIENGVVHIQPADSVGSKVNFLNEVIPHFAVSDKHVSVASYLLRQQVRLRQTSVRENNSVGYATSITSGLGDRKISLKLSNARVRDILDALALAADLKIWVVTFKDSSRRQTVSLYNDNIPELEQPHWDFLFWGWDPMKKQFRHDWKARR